MMFSVLGLLAAVSSTFSKLTCLQVVLNFEKVLETVAGSTDTENIVEGHWRSKKLEFVFSAAKSKTTDTHVHTLLLLALSDVHTAAAEHEEEVDAEDGAEEDEG